MIKIINHILWLQGKLDRIIIVQMHNAVPASEQEAESISNKLKERLGKNIIVIYDELKLPSSIQYVYFKKDSAKVKKYA